MIFQAVRGTQDLLPSALRTWRSLEQKAFRIADLYGFQEIRTPLFEKADLFVKGLGVMAGIVERELWTFHDKHGLKLALRPDMTASVVRAYQQHNLARDFVGLGKLCYLAPVFLLGKEGDEPSRQAHHFGLEVFGSASAAVDAELLTLAWEFCSSLGLENVHLELNTLGCSRCRPAHHDALREFLSSRQTELCGTCKRRYRAHPTWTLSCPESSCSALANLAPTMLGYLCQDCKFHFNQLKFFLKEMQLDIQFNPRVVRDLEYYTRTVFRVVAGDRTIACGGRYDGLFQHLGGTDTPAVGLAFYMDEITALLPEEPGGPDEVEVVFLPEGDEAIRVLLPVCQNLRRQGIRVEILYDNGELMPPSRFAVRLLEREAFRGTADIKDFSRGSIEKVSPEKLTIRLLSLLGLSEESAGGRGLRRRLQRSRRDSAPPIPSQRAIEVSRNDEPGDRDRDIDRMDSDKSENGANGAEAADESEGGRRRKRRRRRRGEGAPVESSVDSLPVDDPIAEEEVADPSRQEEEQRPSERGERHRGERAWSERAERQGPPAGGARNRGGARQERKGEPTPAREDSPPRRNEPAPRRAPAPSGTNREEPAKTFIPALILGGMPAPQTVSSREGPAKANPAALPVPVTPVPTEGGSPVLNWSVSRKPRDGDGASQERAAEDESIGEERQPEAAYSGPRRTRRRR